MDSKKNICIVSSQYLPHVGGVEQYVDNFARHLVKMGHCVTIITSSVEGALEYEKTQNMEIYRLLSIPFMNGRFPVLKRGKKLRQFTKEMKKRKFDVMLVNMRFYFMSLYGVRLAKKMNVRCIMLDHGTSHLNTGGKLTSKLGELFEHGITWLEKRYCREYAGVSGATLEWVRHFNINSNIRLYNAVDLEKFDSMKKKQSIDYRKEFGIPKDDIVISFVGRITLEKGIRQLVNVVNRICQERDDVWLLAAGDGYLMEELNEKACSHIKLLGQVDMNRVVAVLLASEIFCLPSFSEGFPTCVLEAGICDNYVITTQRGGAKELITGEEYGMILPDNNEEGLYKAISGLLDRKEYRKEAALRCRQRIESQYTWKNTAQAFIDLL